GGYLPTEAEWLYAAAGGAEQRAFAWSEPPGLTTITAERASFSPQMDQCNGGGSVGCSGGDLIHVGPPPQGARPWGPSDMPGNVFEWTPDWLGPYKLPCPDCAILDKPAPPNPVYRIMRGGSFVSPVNDLRTTYRDASAPTQRNYIIGIRCARAP